MTDKFLLTKRQVQCEACGAVVAVPVTTRNEILECKSCNTIYEYNPKIKLASTLVFEEGKLILDLTSSVVIGRETDEGYITLMNVLDKFIIQNTHIRNFFVSRHPHAKISLNQEFIFYSEGNSRRIIEKKRFFIEDCGSMNGTSINDCMLKPNEKRELKNDDQIALAPLSASPLVITYRESIHES